MAVGAVHDVATPPLAQPGYVEQLVHQPGGHRRPRHPRRPPVGEREPEAVVLPSRGDDLAVATGRRTRAPRRGHARSSAGGIPSWPSRPCSPQRARTRRSGVDHEDRAAGAGQHGNPVQPGGTAAEHHDPPRRTESRGDGTPERRRIPASAGRAAARAAAARRGPPHDPPSRPSAARAGGGTSAARLTSGAVQRGHPGAAGRHRADRDESGEAAPGDLAPAVAGVTLTVRWR